MTSSISRIKRRSYYKLRDIADAVRCSIPASLIPPRRDLGQELCIGITTYEARYETYFKPLYFQLTNLFPDVPILVVANGSNDSTACSHYLNLMEREIIAGASFSHSFILHDRISGLAQMWNELLVKSLPRSTLIFNDDMGVFPMFRRWAEAIDWTSCGLITINSRFSCFSVDARTVARVGAFDQQFTGFGWEDVDYQARAQLLGVHETGIRCPYVVDLMHTPTATSFDDISTRAGKYSQINLDHFHSKWTVSENKADPYILSINANLHHISGDLKLPLLPRKGGLDIGQCRYPDRS
jgi:hypothetical protein